MRAFVIVALLAMALPLAAPAQAASSFTVDPVALNLGFMNVFELDGTTFQFGSPWGFGDLAAEYNGGVVTLSPNTIDDTNVYWYNCPDGVDPIDGQGDGLLDDCGQPGASGNKLMEAVSYAEVLDGSLAGTTVNFSFEVLSNTLTSEHVVAAFIRDWTSDFSSVNQTVVALTSTGLQMLTLDTINDATRVVQYGFIMRGPNVWVTDVGQFGNMEIGPDQAIPNEQSTFGAVKSLYR
jgi:hypothetical protein